jgi:hypothetical protein
MKQHENFGDIKSSFWKYLINFYFKLTYSSKNLFIPLCSN